MGAEKPADNLRVSRQNVKEEALKDKNGKDIYMENEDDDERIPPEQILSTMKGEYIVSMKDMINNSPYSGDFESEEVKNNLIKPAFFY